MLSAQEFIDKVEGRKPEPPTRYVTVELVGGGWCTIDVHAIHSFGFDGDEIFTVKMGNPHPDVYAVTHDSAVQLIDALDAECVLNDLRIGAV